MVNFIWLFLLSSGIIMAAFNGKMSEVTTAAFDAARMGVFTSFEIIGMMCLWLGMLKIADEAGLVRVLARIIRPLMVKLFPSIPPQHPAIGAVLMNLGANILGLGNAATPFGLKAMQHLQSLNKDKDTASDAMITFLALNTSCITLIPVTVMGLRVAAGSKDPTIIVFPTILATLCGTLVAVSIDAFIRSRGEKTWHK